MENMSSTKQGTEVDIVHLAVNGFWENQV